MNGTPTRVCLAGEDLDWMGGRSVCVAIDLLTSVDERNKEASGHSLSLGKRIARSLASKNLIPPFSAEFPELHSLAPMASGLSTSTSAAIEYIKYLLSRNHVIIHPKELMELSYQFEFETVRGGGMDQTSIILGGCVFTDGRESGLPFVLDHHPFPTTWQIVVLDSGVRKDTQSHISKLRARLSDGDQKAAEYQEVASSAATKVWGALLDEDLELLQQGIAESHAAMRDLQDMSTPALEAIRLQAESLFSLPFKITGAGGGGCLVAVANSDVVHDVELYGPRLYEDLGVKIMTPGAMPPSLQPRIEPATG